MKYNYLERYNLTQIIQELQIDTGIKEDQVLSNLSDYEKKQIELATTKEEILIEKIYDLKDSVKNYEEAIFPLKNKNPQLEKAYANLYIYANNKDGVSRIQNNIKDVEYLKKLYNDFLSIVQQFKNFKEVKQANKEKQIIERFQEIIQLSKDIIESDKINIIKIKENFENLKNGETFFKLKSKEVKYYFFYEKKLYILKLAIFEKKKMKFANFMFMASEKFINEDINFFIDNFDNSMYYTLDTQKLEDSASFWLKIATIIKLFSKQDKVYYFAFSGAEDKQKLTNLSSKIATKNSFEDCKIYLKLNLNDLNDDSNENWNKILLDVVDKTIKNQLSFLDKNTFDIITNYNKTYNDLKNRIESLDTLENTIKKDFKTIISDFKFKAPKQEMAIFKEKYEQKQNKILNELNQLNFYKKERNIINTFLNNLTQLKDAIDNINTNKNFKNLVKLNDIITKITIQYPNFLKADRDVRLIEDENYQEKFRINFWYDDLINNFKKTGASIDLIYELNKDISDFLYSTLETILLEINTINIKLITCYIYKFEIKKQIKKTEKDGTYLKSSDWVKKFNAIFNNIVKAYKIQDQVFYNLKMLKNVILDSFLDDIENLTSYSKISLEQFGIALTNALQQVSKQEKTFTLHKDYKDRLKEYLKMINKTDLNNKNTIRNFINDIEFDPQYSYYTKEEINQINLKIKAGWLMSFTEKGLMSLFNAREKRYFRILVKDLKIPIDDITYRDDIMFRVN